MQLPRVIAVQKIGKPVNRRLGMKIAETLNQASLLMQEMALAEYPHEADRLRRMAFSLDQTANVFWRRGSHV